MLGDVHSQAAQMTLAPGATEGGPDNNHQYGHSTSTFRPPTLQRGTICRLAEAE